MKHLLLFLLLTISVLGQTTGKFVGSSMVITDSLRYVTTGTADSVMIVDLGFNFNWVRIFVQGNANDPVDSIGVKFGTIRYRPETGGSRMFVPVDTVWGGYVPLKDLTWETTNTIVNSSAGKDYFILAPKPQLIWIGLLNFRVAPRTSTITIQATKE